jgi:uncharacterized protein YbbC (DUF1343 family)
VGAPWVDGMKLAEALNARNLAGIRFYPVSFRPANGKYAGELCHGVFLVITDREALRPLRLGIEIAAALFRLHPDRFDSGETWRLVGSKRVLESLKAGTPPSEVATGWAVDEARWRTRRAQYLLYY